jgi:hypothetical protein
MISRETDRLSLDDYYDHHLHCRIDNEPDWFDCFSRPGDDHQELQDFAAAILVD